MESARLATPEDRKALGNLADRARLEMGEKRGGDILDRLDVDRDLPAGSIDRVLDRPGGVVVVGCIDDTPVGFGTMLVDAAADARPHAVVEQIYVDPGGRAVGVGEAMINLLIVEATALGAIGIESVALPGDRATKNFFESQGMVARAIIVHRWLHR
ncbi:MAG: GNAT family N-acetyltransferase [Actinobacteria bacterium]|nr:GNAT family N-acetyltransferase [Actinomycetota bacterium]